MPRVKKGKRILDDLMSNLTHYFLPLYYRLEVIPGIQTSILQYEHNILLEIDIAHKILRLKTVLDVMYDLYRRNKAAFHNNATREIVGTIVMTT